MRTGEEIKEAKRYKYAVSLLVASIDDFTNLNREQGRVAADLVLKEIAAELRSGCRDSDTMARYGREKFAVLLPEASAEDALRVGERLRKDRDPQTRGTADGQHRHRAPLRPGVRVFRPR